MHQLTHSNFNNLPHSNFYLLDRDSCVYMGMQSRRAVLKKPYFYGSLNSPEAADPSPLNCVVLE